MRVFESYAQLQTALDLAPDAPGAFRFLSEYLPAGFRCYTCGHVKPFPADGISTGYGLDGQNNMHCFDCCTARDIESLRDRTRPVRCYLSGDGKRVINWPGGTLGKVYGLTVSRSGWHGSEIARFHVRDVHGQWWHGRGAGTGMGCTLRPMKHTPGYARSWGLTA